MKVSPGDLLVGDDDGLVVIERALVRVNYPDRPATTILAGGGGGIF